MIKMLKSMNSKKEKDKFKPKKKAGEDKATLGLM